MTIWKHKPRTRSKGDSADTVVEKPKCWAEVFGCTTVPVFGLTITQPGRKPIRVKSCRQHVSLYQKPLHGIRNVQVSLYNLGHEIESESAENFRP